MKAILHQPGKSFMWLISSLLVADLFGLLSWIFLISFRDSFPVAESKSARLIFGQYIGVAYDIFLVVVISSITMLALLLIAAKKKEDLIDKNVPKKYLGTRVASFINKNKLVSIIIIVYSIVLINEATWMHGELMGWIKDGFAGNFLDNFSIRQDFVDETLRRDDYRLFPLAHQDLHVLSWFTPFVKVMMLFSIVQLVTIIICINRFIKNMFKESAIPGLLLLSTLLILFSSSFANAFFQLDYPERILTFLFSMYALTYLDYRNSKRRSSIYATLIISIFGIYWKDTGFILFIFPAFCLLVCDLFNEFKNVRSGEVSFRNVWSRICLNNELELYLCSLFLFFIFSYIFLSLIPSSFMKSASYADDSIASVWDPSVKYILFCVIVLWRFVLIFMGKLRFGVFDTLNLSAILYSIALFTLVGFKVYSHHNLPVEYVCILNLLWVWALAAKKLSSMQIANRSIALIGFSGFAALAGVEHLDGNTSFYGHASRVHELHNSWEQTFDHVDKLTRELIREGKEVNLIYRSNSWFDFNRHLNRLRYDRLIEWNEGRRQFLVKDGANYKSVYTPESGDLFINIDRNDDIFPDVIDYSFEKVFQFDHRFTGLINGQVFRLEKLGS